MEDCLSLLLPLGGGGGIVVDLDPLGGGGGTMPVVIRRLESPILKGIEYFFLQQSF